MSVTLERANATTACEEHDTSTLHPGSTRFLVATACPHGAFPRRVEMPIEAYDEGERRLVRAYLPGADPDRDIMVTMRERELRLRCHRRLGIQGCDSTVPHDVTFDLVVSVPAGTTSADVAAEYGDGVLLVSIPTARAASARGVSPQGSHRTL
jgi:HSP20 family protein